MPEEAVYLKMLSVVVFEPAQNWRPKSQDWFAVLQSNGPHPMRILRIGIGTCLKKNSKYFSLENFSTTTKDSLIVSHD